MFTVSERTEVRARLVARAAADPHITGAALVGSAVRGTEDRWSDIDLMLQLHPEADEPVVVTDWSRFIDDLLGVGDIHDVFAGAVRYRVFFMTSSLQIDLSFWPHEQFTASDSGFQLLFGTAGDPTTPQPPDAGHTIGRGWLYAIHARSAVARGKLWQATMMLDELRNSVVTLQCIRAGLEPWHGREVDRLPANDLRALDESRATQVTAESLDRSRILLNRMFLNEVAHHDPERFARLREPISRLSEPAG